MLDMYGALQESDAGKAPPYLDAGWDPTATAAAICDDSRVASARLSFLLDPPEDSEGKPVRIVQDIDRLIPSEAGYDVVLVRPITRVRGEAQTEGALAAIGLERLGADVHRVSVVFANRGYGRGEHLDPRELLRQSDITRQVRGHVKQVAGWLARLHDLAPGVAVPPDYACENLDCELCNGRRDGLSPDHVRHLIHGRETARDLLKRGVFRMGDIPDSVVLTRSQKRQVAACVEDAVYIDCERLREFLYLLSYPLGFLDFEAVSRVVPKQPGVRVGQHVPFLYSLHVAEKPGGRLDHAWSGEGDLRPLGFAEALLRDLERIRTIVAFGAAFERRMLAFLAERAPGYAERLIAVAARIVDVALPFQRVWVYHPDQRGSLSLKRVAAAWAGVGYADLQLADGGAANYLYAAAQDADGASAELMSHLVDYCSRDTHALAEVVFALQDRFGSEC
ncbi:MAG: DUF2779 domain-containing protein [Spirochaetota bacterium]